MASEFEKYKSNRIIFLTNIYNVNIANLKIKYNNDLILINRRRSSFTQKNNAIRILTNKYNNDVDNLKNKLNSDIAYTQNMIMDLIYLKNKKYALSIGINYTGTPYKLNGCINDAINIQKRCSDTGFKNLILLNDNTQKKPSKINILNELKYIMKNSYAGDLIVFTYSGHGSYRQDTNGDEKDRRDEMIISIDLKPILDDELKDIIQTNLKKDVTLFALFDSCYSGTVLDLKYQYYDSSNYDEYTENDKTIETNGNIIMISGCSDNQTSVDSYFNNTNQGVLTWAFLESLKTLISPSWRELIKKMRDLIKENNYEQIPQLSSGKFVDIDSKIFV